MISKLFYSGLLLLAMTGNAQTVEKEIQFEYFKQFDEQLLLMVESPVNTRLCYNDKEFALVMSDKVTYHYDVIHIGNAEAWNIPSKVYTVKLRDTEEEQYFQVFTNPRNGVRLISGDLSYWFFPYKP